MPPKTLKIDLAAKPESTPEDEYLVLNLLGDSFDPSKIDRLLFRNAISNIFLEAFSADFTLSKESTPTLIPESPSEHNEPAAAHFPKIASPRSIMSPFFETQPKMFEEDNMIMEKILPRVEPPKEYSNTNITLSFENYDEEDENDIITAICELYPEGFTIHTQHIHPTLVKAENLAKLLGRTEFEPDEELRIVNDVLFEGVFGLPGFLGWTAVPLILSHYTKEYSVDVVAEQLLTHGEVIEQFLSEMNESFVLTPELLRKWYAEMYENKPLSVRFFNALKLPGSDELTIFDIERVCFVLLKLHPGLSFLQDAPNFEQLYAETVSYRVLFENDVHFRGFLIARDLKKIQCENGTRFSNDLLLQDSTGGLLESFWQSEFEQDINKNLKCFSYEHFYVFYVTFWELDLDHDKMLTLYDLERYQQGTLSKFASKRIFDALIQIRLKMPQVYCEAYIEINKQDPTDAELLDFCREEKLYYPDFVRFLIYIENPDLDVSVYFILEICDLDADNAIGFADFDYFFKFEEDKMEANGIDLLDSRDVFCQLLDFYKCAESVDVAAIMRSESRGNLFSVMAHYIRLEQFDEKDPYTLKNYLVPEKTMWEKFCRRQYDLEVEGAQGDGF